MKPNRPLLIVTSCTRNYGWVTRAFLEGNTRWADFIVIVDQMSTDVTRPLIEEYNKLHNDEMSRLRLNEPHALNDVKHRAEIVIVDDPDMTYKENTRAKMGFMRGRELAAGRDAIYFALDIDEVMPAKWMKTEDGKKILTSKPGDMFQLEWANIMPDGKTCDRSGWQYKIFHDNGMAWQDVDGQIHTPLLPYTTWDTIPEEVHDFPLIHFGKYHVKWMQCKKDLYQIVDVQQKRTKSAISLYRVYNRDLDEWFPNIQVIDKEWLFSDVDLIGMVDVVSVPIFMQYIQEILFKEGTKKYQSLDIWTKEFCAETGIKDPRSSGWRILHAYLRATQKHHDFVLWKGIDKVLKRFV